MQISQFQNKNLMIDHEKDGLKTRQEAMYCDLAQFVQTENKELQNRLQMYSWEEYSILLKDTKVPQSIKQASCVALKSLIYSKKSMNSPMEMLKEFINFYLEPDGEKLTKVQETSEIVIQQIISIYLNHSQKEGLINEIVRSFSVDIQMVERKVKIISNIIETMDPESINNENLIKQNISYLKNLLTSPSYEGQKNKIIYQLLKQIDQILSIVDEEQEKNIPQLWLRTSEDAKIIFKSIIFESSKEKQIITASQLLNRVKTLALELYKRVWGGHLQQDMFQLFFNSLLLINFNLSEQQPQIMEYIISMLDRSLYHPAYAEQVYPQSQQIIINLLHLLAQISEDEFANSDPEYFVEILADFCKGDKKETLLAKLGSLLVSFCNNVDGCLSFLGGICIMVIKNIDPSLQKENERNFILNMSEVWNVSDEEKLSVSLMMLAALADQIEKRKDLEKPLYFHLYSLNKNFVFGKNGFPPHIICKFMNLYAIYGYCGSLDVFLPYKSSLPVYQYQLEACYQAFIYYHLKKGEQLQNYIADLGKKIVICNELTPLFEKTITVTTDQNILKHMQIPILEQLVKWLQIIYSDSSEGLRITKLSSLVVILLNKFTIHSEQEEQKVVYSYLQPLYKNLISSSHQFQESILEIVLNHLKLFPCMKKKEERVNMFLEICSIIVQRNNFRISNCLDIYANLVNDLREEKVKQLLKSVIQIIPKQEREQELWECFYFVEVCLVQIGRLKSNLPQIPLAHLVFSILSKVSSKILYMKLIQVLLAIFLINPNINSKMAQAIRSLVLPQKVPLYENKAYIMYLIGFLRVPNHPFQYLRSLLNLICLSAKRENQLKNQNKNYQSELPELDESQDEVTTNSLMRSQTIIHPLCQPSVDFHQFFKDVWEKYSFGRSIKIMLSEDELNNIRDLWNEKLVSNQARRVFKIKQLKISL